MRTALRFVRKTPCLTLLVVQLLGVVLYPFLPGSSWGPTAFSAFGIVVLVLTMRALRATPFFSWFSAFVFVPAVVLLVVSVVVESPAVVAASAAFESVLYFYAGISMLAYMLKDDDVSLDEMFAIPAVFTLFAWAFAYLYVVLQVLDPGAWGDPRDWMELLFLSFTTLSSTGLSDIVPVTGHARSVVMLEQLAGIFYIAMVVTRLVALRSNRPAAPR